MNGDVNETMSSIQLLRDRFCKTYAYAGVPEVCRAPGRVNLIGEHTDYNGLPVLPMALRQSVRIAFAPKKNRLIQVRNANPRYADATFQNGPDIPPSPPGDWTNYCKAAVQGLNVHFGVRSYPGMDLLVDADLPAAAGLSSSSAMVVASSLAYLRAIGKTLEKDISRLELAALLASAEHYVGTRGGGMDQAVIINGKAGYACKIDFFPVRTEHVPLLDDHVIVVCDSTVRVEKSGDALHAYNAGPRLSRLATALLEQTAKAEFDDGVQLERIGDLYFGPLCLTHLEVTELCERTFVKPGMILQEAATRLQCTTESIRERWIGDLPEPSEGFPLQARVRHLRTEFRRVEEARDALQAGDPAAVGALMDESHRSCAGDYFISSPELDVLTQAARNAGAVGARLTGAGFGGATVNLVPTTEKDTFIERITASYYRRYLDFNGNVPVFIAEAGDGAGYLPSSAG